MPRTKKTTTEKPAPKAKKLKIMPPKSGRQTNQHQKECTHLRYDPTAPIYYGAGRRDATPEEWAQASAYMDLPMPGATGRCYQRCAKCGATRYKPGHEMPAPAPKQKAEPMKQETLFDLSAIPVDPNYKKGRKRV